MGVETPFLSRKIKEKIRQANIERYGCENPFQSEEIKEKIRQTNVERYGVKSPAQSPNIREKMEQTNMKRYGVKHAAQNPKIAERSSINSYRYNDYTFPSGKVVKCQGYEHFALDHLLEFIEEEDIVTGVRNVPTVWYTDDDNKKHSHTPDIYIPFINTCIEVKSTWTAKKKHDCIFRKQEAAKALGYNYEIWIYNAKGEKVETHK